MKKITIFLVILLVNIFLLGIIVSLSFYPRPGDFLVERAVQNVKAGNSGIALRELKMARLLGKGKSSEHVGLAIAYYDLGRYEDAIRELEAARVLGQGSSAMSLLSCCYAHINEREKALQMCKKVSQNLDERDSSKRYNLACAYSVLGMYGVAMSYLEEAVGINPEHKIEAANDRDFLNLRNKKAFKELVL